MKKLFETARAGKRHFQPRAPIERSFVSAVLAYGEKFSPIELSELERLCTSSEKLELTAELRRARRAGFVTITEDEKPLVYFGDEWKLK